MAGIAGYRLACLIIRGEADTAITVGSEGAAAPTLRRYRPCSLNQRFSAAICHSLEPRSGVS